MHNIVLSIHQTSVNKTHVACKQDLVKLIFDVKKMTETVIEMQYDANKVDVPRYS